MLAMRGMCRCIMMQTNGVAELFLPLSIEDGSLWLETQPGRRAEAISLAQELRSPYEKLLPLSRIKAVAEGARETASSNKSMQDVIEVPKSLTRGDLIEKGIISARFLKVKDYFK